MRLLIYFKPKNQAHLDLMSWVTRLGRANLSDFGREAFECYRRFDGSLETANAAGEIARLFSSSLTEAQEARRALDEKRQKDGE